jgi:hypothetical protein
MEDNLSRAKTQLLIMRLRRGEKDRTPRKRHMDRNRSESTTHEWLSPHPMQVIRPGGAYLKSGREADCQSIQRMGALLAASVLRWVDSLRWAYATSR